MNITTAELDALKEIANMGIGNAATALSGLIAQRVDITIPEIKMDSIHNILSDETMQTIATKIEIEGDLGGKCLLVYSKDEALELIKSVMNQQLNGKSEIDMTESVFKETTNIISGAYLGALSDFLKMKILPGVPLFLMGDVCNLISTFFEDSANPVLSITTELKLKSGSLKGIFMLVLDNRSLDTLIKKIHEVL